MLVSDCVELGFAFSFPSNNVQEIMGVFFFVKR